MTQEPGSGRLLRVTRGERSETGSNPFIVASKGMEDNRFRALLRDLDLECYILNTGYGAMRREVGVEEAVTILCELPRGTVKWAGDECTGLTGPASVPDLYIGSIRADTPDDHERVRYEVRAELARTS